MIFTDAQYTLDVEGKEKSHIRVKIDGVESLVPLDPANTDYAEILKQVEAKTLTIKDAD
tara:strand:+ start:1694 stop:1870 length:177 start_codon:yes stop_codon:yes gene_type:complete